MATRLPQTLQSTWWEARALLQGVRSIRGWVEPHFYGAQVGPLPKGLSAAAHYLRHGWREGRQPHPLFDPAFYRRACIHSGVQIPETAPLLHFCQHGARAGVPCSPLLEPSWWTPQRIQRLRRTPPSLAAVHPLGQLALELCNHNQSQATQRLLGWYERGLSAVDLSEIVSHCPSLQPAAAIPKHRQLALLEGSALDWRTHAWLQHLTASEVHQLSNIGGDGEQGNPQTSTTLLLLLNHADQEALAVERLVNWWRVAKHAEQLIVTDPSIGCVLQAMGIRNVALLRPANPAKSWLKDENLLAVAQTDLGLPPPAGLPSGLPLVLGEAGAGWLSSLSDRLIALPGWDNLEVQTSDQAKAQAAWLQRCGENGHPLVLLNPKDPGTSESAMKALALDAQCLEGSFSEDSLLRELDWHRQGCPAPELHPTPSPEHTVLWHHKQTKQELVQVSVCISLHNYAHTIERALESLRGQTLPGSKIEVLVVDDASTDGGEAWVKAWMEKHGMQFGRCSLIQHHRNGGLAAARNTAFKRAQAEWCFVLDADNLLHPSALEACLAVATHTHEETAVVHPLIAREDEVAGGQRIRTGLHSIALWQQQRFVQGNHIDAMALVRRSAWQAVGGYTHIPGGWEDFDFWCCLIEAGWHGVSLPQVICSYVVHSNSMLATTTNPNLRQLCRLMQRRHPWLKLDPNDFDPASHTHHT